MRRDEASLDFARVAVGPVETLRDAIATREAELERSRFHRGNRALLAERVRRVNGGSARVLELGCGHLDFTTRYLRPACAEVVATDVEQLFPADHRLPEGVSFQVEDALALSFADESFDCVTISWALRNVNDVTVALAEMLRVTRPGGRLVVLENSHPTWKPFRIAYLEYMMRAVPVLARAVSTNPEAYVYLAESVRAWHDQPALARIIEDGGWTGVEWLNLSGGLVAIHRATKPGG